MAFRRFLRGQVDPPTLERVAREVAERADEAVESVRPLQADNWLSTPVVVNERYFLKVITAQNSLVHALLTASRNLGVFSSGAEGFFEHYGTPLEMAEHELEATEQTRELGVNAPEPLDAFEFEGLGVLVLEYLPRFEPLDALDRDALDAVAPALFESLARMHDAGLVHGDLRAENVLVADGEVYFIDATKVSEAAVPEARSYDVACALATLSPLLGAREAVRVAAGSYDHGVLLDAEDYLDFVNMRPDHDFDAAATRGAIEHRVA
ncbi:MAG: RIO1 family regulatory kinase/ATPase [Haloarculaceae archaeon]